MSDKILLGHGSGGTMTRKLIENLIVKTLGNPTLNKLTDAATLNLPSGRLAMTTDSFVVTPPVFPGGDIGKLAVYGTINDLVMVGTKPFYLSLAFILEEGIELELFRRIVDSIAEAAENVGVEIVTGDTKVVEKGKGDQIYINTTGIGIIPDGIEMSPERIQVGDKVILSGTMGDHGITILACRKGLEMKTDLKSDCAPLHRLVNAMLDVEPKIRVMRDPTRGGVASVLNEIAEQAGVEIKVEESRVPILPQVQGMCDLLGLDPFHVANEGKLIAVVPAESAEEVLSAMRALPEGKDAAIIGEVVAKTEYPEVFVETEIGTTRILEMLAGDQLPRIC
ncbi:hydrogenase expression/formation protein HypE [Anoxybacter fermentans]|uniref:Hydrogenase expression/formation protein HypE n=1 Tax=Anoxybacter fermentans TaxID=1323375 RepID=A0A3Q9HQ56_9FIRM|nr:hydrogenase expression/formation protein HypE [Anoxybacter fermentans]AZR72939.1 hydrogenase expression/formation protein HypE [Anoxybacter fermentans]